jgi:hypothetical protein
MEATEITDRPVAHSRPQRAGRGFRASAPVLVAAAAVLVALAGLAMFGLSGEPEAAPLPYVIKVQPTNQSPEQAFVEERPPEEPKEAAARAPEAATAIAPAERLKPTRAKASTARRAKRTTKPPAASQPDSLTGRFRSQQAGIVRCLQGAKAADNGELSIRFSIDRSGKVVDAVVLPAELANSVTGRCIQTAAQRIVFGAQKEPLKFRIPLRTRTL